MSHFVLVVSWLRRRCFAETENSVPGTRVL